MTRRLIMDLVCIVIFKPSIACFWYRSYSMTEESSTVAFILLCMLPWLQALNCSAHSTNNKSRLAIASVPSHRHFIQYHLHPF